MAALISFVRSKGAFAGVSLEGAIIKTKDKWNRVYYNNDVRPVDIIVRGAVVNPGSAELRETVKQAFDRASKLYE
jgi:lipid-binding SYLF domain-containing protein